MHIHVPISPPSWASLPSSLSHPSRSSQSTKPISLCYVAASHQPTILHLVVYVCPCHSLTSPRLRPPTPCPQVHFLCLPLYSFLAISFLVGSRLFCQLLFSSCDFGVLVRGGELGSFYSTILSPIPLHFWIKRVLTRPGIFLKPMVVYSTSNLIYPDHLISYFESTSQRP